MNRFWWLKSATGKGMHCCSWLMLSISNDYRGMVFCDLSKFNIALLAKQGWRFLTKPKSLVARIFKAKYFSNVDFLGAR